MRYIGLDVGDRTVGVAVSDPLGFTAQGITTIRRKSLEADIEALGNLFKDYEISAVIVGLPKNMDGSIGPQAEKAMAFGRQVADALALEVIFWDERLTTKAAHRVMLEADFSRKKRKGLVDKIAATYILQGYLDRLSSTK